MNSVSFPKTLHPISAFVILRIFLGAGLSATSSRAESIGINFIGTDAAGGALAPGDVAGAPGYAQAFWNNHVGGFTTISNLVDNLGNTTTANAEARGGKMAVSLAGSGPDFTLMRGALQGVPPGTGVVISSVPYSVYDLIVYMSGPLYTGGTDGNVYFRAPDFNVSPPIASASTFVKYSSPFAGNFVAASPTAPGNYFRFSGLTYSSVGVGSDYFNLAAVQIIAVPEPAANALLWGGLLLLGVASASSKKMSEEEPQGSLSR